MACEPKIFINLSLTNYISSLYNKVGDLKVQLVQYSKVLIFDNCK